MPNSNYAAEDVAAAARTIIAQSGQKKIDVLGWSWGTVTSGRFAAKHPELVRSAGLCSMHPSLWALARPR